MAMLAVIGGGFGLFVQPAVIQAAAELVVPADEIIITAPYTVHKKLVTRDKGGIPVEKVSLMRKVSFVGLDLTKPADVAEFKRRVEEVANDACKQLDTLYPESLYPSEGDNKDCVKEAIANAMMQAGQTIPGFRS
jgi:UrcA family protein